MPKGARVQCTYPATHLKAVDWLFAVPPKFKMCRVSFRVDRANLVHWYCSNLYFGLAMCQLCKSFSLQLLFEGQDASAPNPAGKYSRVVHVDLPDLTKSIGGNTCTIAGKGLVIQAQGTCTSAFMGIYFHPRENVLWWVKQKTKQS
jgi:hypothetical protein